MFKILTAPALLSFICLMMTVPIAVSAEQCKPATFTGAIDGEMTLCQNWDADQQQAFWFTPQGSRIIPYSWLLALTKADGSGQFVDNSNLEKYRYLTQEPTPLNPDGLPIGFTRDEVAETDPASAISSEWFGLTCAACHTGQVEFNGAKLLIDGAPSLADFEGFMWSLEEALSNTLNDDARFSEFASKVVGNPADTANDADELKSQLREVTEQRSAWNDLNRGDHDYGFGRLDAIGAIFNAVAVSAQGFGNEKGKSANAPVSYPFVWDTPHHDYVQWNASVANAGPGALGRNVGEVLGVFGLLEYNPIDGDTSQCIPGETGFFGRLLQRVGDWFIESDQSVCIGHVSSIKAGGLRDLEHLLWTLQSPQWPEDILGPIGVTADGNTDSEVVANGQAVFERFCLGCHDGRSKESDIQVDFKRDDPNRRIEAQKIPLEEVGTDPMMATNFAKQTYPVSDDLKGQAKSFLQLKFPLKREHFFGSEGKGAEFVSYAVRGVILNLVLNDPEQAIEAIKLGQTEETQQYLDLVKARLLEARDSTNIDKLKLLIRLIEEAESKKIVNWTQGLGKAGVDLLRAQIKALIDKDQGELEAGMSAQAAKEALKKLLVYKARPLNGIWATGPFLHNGSVRTIRQMMLPAACPESGIEVDATTGKRLCRQKSFRVGTREYDPKNLGFADGGEFVIDTSLPGNHNMGHEFGTTHFKNNPQDLEALLEYLKTL